MKVYSFDHLGNFQEEIRDFKKGSINTVAGVLGYQETQFHSVLIFEKTHGIETIRFIPLTKKPIFMIASSKSKLSNKKRDVMNLIESIDWGLEYNGSSVEFILDDAKDSGEWDIEFIQKVTGEKVENEDQVLPTQYGYDFIIMNGKLVDYQSNDNLNSWAKELLKLNEEMATGYYNEGVTNHNGDKSKGRDYLNLQADFWGKTPNSVSNQYARKYTTRTGWIDFFTLMVIEYNYRIKKHQLILRGGEGIVIIKDNSNFSEYEFDGYNYKFIGQKLDSVTKI